MKANIARIDKGKNFDVNAKVSKPMSKTPPMLNKNYVFAPLVIVVILLVILGQIVLS